MSFGIPLSQLIDNKPDPLHTGIPDLDKLLGNGLQSGSIYEIFGLPGIGKTTFGIELTVNALKRKSDDNILWIETFVSLPSNLIERFIDDNVFQVRIEKFIEILIFFDKLNQDNSKDFKLIIIDGFSQLLVNHLNYLMSKKNISTNGIHDIKCKNLILLFSSMTKYATKKNSTIVLLNNCMNTSYQQQDFLNSNNNYEDNFEILDDGSNFFVSSSFSLPGINGSMNSISSTVSNNSTRRNVQILKSALIANSGMGSKDSKWQIFLKGRIGLFWDWETNAEHFENGKSHRPEKIKIAILYGNRGGEETNRQNIVKVGLRRSQSERTQGTVTPTKLTSMESMIPTGTAIIYDSEDDFVAD